jgi:hypothetical protein
MIIDYLGELDLCLSEQYPDFLGFITLELKEGYFIGLCRIKMDCPSPIFSSKIK